LDKTLRQTELPGLPAPQRGKVRDIYDLSDRLLLVTTDRVSAFDVVLGTIPCKGQVLCSIASHWFEKTADLAQNHLIDVPDPCAMLVRKLKPLPVEVVMRRYLTGSLFREYESGNRTVYGLELPDGMKKDQRFEEPLLTPTTKAELGQHDLPLTSQETVEQRLVEPDLWREVQKIALALFTRGEEEARSRDLILVDTKYEFGLDADRLVVMDEIHTPDSSRYWELSEYQSRYAQGQAQHMLDKENIRQWLIERGFSGEGRPPDLSEDIRVFLSKKYLELQQRLTGTEPDLPVGDPAERLAGNLKKAGIIK
jgi:phosphoribosylaminoimidazole-succinocarboxamide synthase